MCIDIRVFLGLDDFLIQDYTNTQFRNISQPVRSLTTIIAIQCRDGVLLAADSQATAATQWEWTNKIHPINKNSLIASSGADRYITLLEDHVEHSLSQLETNEPYYLALNRAVKAYSKEILEDFQLVPNPTNAAPPPYQYPSAIFAVHDSNLAKQRIFTIRTPDPCLEITEYPYRATLGSGAQSADIFLKTIEYAFAKTQIRTHWTNLSTQLVGAFCYILLRRIAYLDPNTKGCTIYRLGADEPYHHEYQNTELFPDWNPEDKHDYQLRHFMKQAIKEIGTEKVAKLVQEYKINDLTWLGF